MTFLLTAVPMSRRTRRRIGKSFTAVVDADAKFPFSVEQKFERDYAIEHPQEIAKVIDVREVAAEREGTCVCGVAVARHFDGHNRKLSCEEVGA
jgi:hypothetical protein